MAAIGIGVTGLVGDSADLGLMALVFAISAIHPALRLRRPGTGALDSVVVDLTVVFSLLTLLRPPVTVEIVALGYVIPAAVLFLRMEAASWIAIGALAGVGAIDWITEPGDRLGTGETVAVAAVLAVAGLPLVAWAVGRVTASRIRVETALERTAARFEQLFANSVVPMFRTTIDGTLLDGNQALVELFGAASLEALRSEPVPWRYVDPRQRQEFVELLNAEGKVRQFEAYSRKAGGETFWAHVSASVVETDGGPVIEGIIEDVTARRAAEAEARLTAAVFDQLASAVVVADHERRVTKWNRAAEAMFGLQDAGSLGRLAADVLVGTEPGLGDRVRDRLEDEGTWHGEAEIIGADGSPIPCAVSVAAVADHGARSGFAMVFTDLTEIEEARRHLRFQAELLDQVQNAVIATDLEGEVTFWNRAAEHMYGWSAEEALGRSILEVTVPPDQRDAAADILAEIPASGSWSGEFDVARKDGTRFPALVTNAYLHDADGEPIGIVGVSSDLTDLRSAQETAQRLGSLARSVLDSVGFPMALIDHSGEIIDINDAWVQFAVDNRGDLRETGVGANYLEVCRRAARTDPDAGDVADGIEDVLAGRADSFSTEYPCHGPTQRRWFRMEATPVPRIGAVVTHYDTTGNHLAREALEETVRAKDQFLATVSHELRTPLTAVVGFADQLRRGSFESDELDEIHEMVSDQAREVADLVEDLLLVGRLDTGTIVLSSQPVDVVEIVETVVRPWALQQNTRIMLDLPDRRMVVTSDALRLRQVIRNLVSNAVRHGAPPFGVRVESRDGDAVLEVRDGGDGIPEELIDELFEPYATASASRLPGSVGLGLYVSRRLTHLLGGTLEYRREDGSTVFRLVLPAS